MFIFCMILCCFIHQQNCANILILHPLYCGSHELTLRTIGKHLVKQRGHNVTQLMFQHTHINITMAASTDQDERQVNVIPLTIRDREKECSNYVNGEGQFDISGFTAKLLWDSGDKLWHLPSDLFCVTRVHCNMLLNDPILFESLKSSNFDIGRVVVHNVGNDVNYSKLITFGTFTILVLCFPLVHQCIQMLLVFAIYCILHLLIFVVVTVLLMVLLMLLTMTAISGLYYFMHAKSSLKYLL